MILLQVHGSCASLFSSVTGFFFNLLMRNQIWLTCLIILPLGGCKSREQPVAIQSSTSVSLPDPDAKLKRIIELALSADRSAQDTSQQQIAALSEQEKSRLGSLLSSLADVNNSEQRKRIIVFCSRLGPTSKETFPVLIQLMKIDDKEMRLQATRAVGGFGSDAMEAIPQLADALSDPSDIVRYNAAAYLSHLGIAAVPDLSRILTTGDAEARFLAVDTLGRIGLEAQSALPILNSMKDDPDLKIARAAKAAILHIQGSQPN
jgi:HEAT repeat protein